MTAALRGRSIQATLCAGAIVAAGACSTGTPEAVETAASVAVTTAPAVRGMIRGVIHATGVVSPAPGAELVVVAPEPARIAEIPHASGDRVARGDLLVRFEIPAAAADVRKQQAEVARAEAGQKSAEAAQTRARELFDRGVAAGKEVEDANRALADAQAALVQAKVALEASAAVDRRSTVRAAFDGVIAGRSHNPGELVEASASDPILRVIDPDRLEVVAAVPLADASRVRTGAPASIVHAPAGERGTELKIVSRPTAVEPGTANVPVRLGSSRPIGIPLGALVQVAIGAEEHRDVVLVPEAAVVREGGEPSAFVVIDGHAHRREVRTGLADGTSIEIVSGVSAGDRVIVDGQAGLPDGAAVTEAVKSDGRALPARQGGAR